MKDRSSSNLIYALFQAKHVDISLSRSAAEARDFANQVISRRDAKYYRDQANGFAGDCVSLNIRFMGLFDTVLAAEGPTRRAFNMAIPPEVQYVAHAVAVNEHRSKFALESINDGRSETTSRGWHIERGFVGAHADIGGGYDGTKDADVLHANQQRPRRKARLLGRHGPLAHRLE
jgi:uncharacterized protein (DUF2235 family)